MSELPSGTVTFLFTDIEGSTRLERQLRERYGNALEEHQTIVREAFAAHGGREIDTQGDSFFYVFPRAKAAVDAAVEAQRALATHRWPEDGEIRVRMGISTGEASLEGGRYVGFAVHRAARISAAGHGGQILLSSSTRDVVEADLGQGLTVRDLGERRLKDLPRPERVYQLVAEGLPSQFAPLKTLDVEVRRKRRRLYAGAALIGLLVAAVAIPVFALDEGSEGGANVEPNSVAIIDPGSNTVVGSVPVGIRPVGVATGEGSVWVANTDDKTVSRIDTTTRQLVRTIAVSEYPSDIAVTPGLGLGCPGRCPAGAADSSSTGTRPTRSSRRSVPQLGEPQQICGRDQAWLAAGGGALWFVCSGCLGRADASRIDPRKTTRIDDALVSSSPAAVTFTDVAFGLGSAWIADSGANAVRQIAARSLDNVRQRHGRPEAVCRRSRSGICVGRESRRRYGYTSRVVGELTRPDTLATIPVGDAPVDVAVGSDAVWVVNRPQSRRGALGDVRLLRHARRLERRHPRASWRGSSVRTRLTRSSRPTTSSSRRSSATSPRCRTAR